MEDRETMKYLVDRSEITDVVVNFAIAIDTRDWVLFRSCLADEIDIDYPDSVGVAVFSAEKLVSTATVFFSRLDATQHISANHRITIDGDRATCFSTLTAQHYLASETESPVQRQIGYYLNHLERQDRWRITRSEQRVSWNEGNMNVFLHAAGAFQ